MPLTFCVPPRKAVDGHFFDFTTSFVWRFSESFILKGANILTCNAHQFIKKQGTFKSFLFLGGHNFWNYNKVNLLVHI